MRDRIPPPDYYDPPTYDYDLPEIRYWQAGGALYLEQGLDHAEIAINPRALNFLQVALAVKRFARSLGLGPDEYTDAMIENPYTSETQK